MRQANYTGIGWVMQDRRQERSALAAAPLQNRTPGLTAGVKAEAGLQDRARRLRLSISRNNKPSVGRV